MKVYDHKTIEEKWAKEWIDKKTYQPDLEKAENPFYNLMMFPYPSAEGLHVGNMYAFTGADVYGRYQRMKGNDVFEPIGLDGFGIHSENYAIKVGKHPAEQAKVSEERFYKQLSRIGAGYAWDNKLETYDPDYYKWTQWIFAQMFRHGLAYRKKASVNWCPSCKTVLADEQVEDGLCERCKNETTRKETKQWFFRITKYAEKLLNNIEKIDWPNKIKIAQRQWIGKKEGINITYEVVGSTGHAGEDSGQARMTEKVAEVVCFTTTPVNFGATFIVIAPEYELVEKIINADLGITDEEREEVATYVKKALEKTEQERKKGEKDKTGVFTGLFAINHVNGKKIPIWVSDFVLKDVGTGAVQGCPGHDMRDFEFATKYNIPIPRVVVGDDGDMSEIDSPEKVIEKGMSGKMCNSEFLDGLDFAEAMQKTMDYFEEKGWGVRVVSYHLRDWLISRQRYWGPPIPMVKCEECANKKPKVFIVHGTWGSGDGNWFPWLESYLSEFDVKVARPTLPDTKLPTCEDRMSYIENEYGDFIDENTIIIGHSSGSATALHIAETKKVKQILLVAPVMSVNNEYKDKLSGFFDEKTGEALYKLYNRPVDMDKVKKNSGPITCLFGDKDHYLPKTFVGQARELYGSDNVFTYPQYGHFSSDDPKEIFEILDYLPMSEIEMTGWHAADDNSLPVELPDLSDFKPTGDGMAPLEKAGEQFMYTTCPSCGGRAKREVDVSDTFLDSSWYFLRYPSLGKNTNTGLDLAMAWDDEITRKWLPVNTYIGGAEHAVLHLLYSRFVWMALQDWGYIPKSLGDEPFPFLFSHGLIIKDGAKMSKSRGNVVVPDDYIDKYGADTLRMYLMFLGSYDKGGDFRDSGIAGTYRFLSRVWETINDDNKRGEKTSEKLESKLHETIKKMDHDLSKFKYNTAIAALMELFNVWRDPSVNSGQVPSVNSGQVPSVNSGQVPSVNSGKEMVMSKSDIRLVVKLFAPLAPFMAEDIWQAMNNDTVKKGENSSFKSVHLERYPTYDPQKIVTDGVLVVVQVNGKKRSEITIPEKKVNDKEYVIELAKEAEGMDKWLSTEIKREVFVPAKGDRLGLVNFVI